MLRWCDSHGTEILTVDWTLSSCGSFVLWTWTSSGTYFWSGSLTFVIAGYSSVYSSTTFEYYIWKSVRLSLFIRLPAVCRPRQMFYLTYQSQHAPLINYFQKIDTETDSEMLWRINQSSSDSVQIKASINKKEHTHTHSPLIVHVVSIRDELHLVILSFSLILRRRFHLANFCSDKGSKKRIPRIE